MVKNILFIFCLLFIFGTAFINALEEIYAYEPSCNDSETCIYRKSFPNCIWTNELCNSGEGKLAIFECSDVPSNTMISFFYNVTITPEPFFTQISEPNGAGNLIDDFSVFAWHLNTTEQLQQISDWQQAYTLDARRQYMIDNSFTCLNNPKVDEMGKYTETGCLQIGREESSSGNNPIVFETGTDIGNVILFIERRRFDENACMSMFLNIQIKEYIIT